MCKLWRLHVVLKSPAGGSVPAGRSWGPWLVGSRRFSPSRRTPRRQQRRRNLTVLTRRLLPRLHWSTPALSAGLVLTQGSWLRWTSWCSSISELWFCRAFVSTPVQPLNVCSVKITQNRSVCSLKLWLITDLRFWRSLLWSWFIKMELHVCMFSLFSFELVMQL